jgi:hypothetical protein
MLPAFAQHPPGPPISALPKGFPPAIGTPIGCSVAFAEGTIESSNELIRDNENSLARFASNTEDPQNWQTVSKLERERDEAIRTRAILAAKVQEEPSQGTPRPVTWTNPVSTPGPACDINVARTTSATCEAAISYDRKQLAQFPPASPEHDRVQRRLIEHLCEFETLKRCGNWGQKCPKEGTMTLDAHEIHWGLLNIPACNPEDRAKLQ